MSNDTAGIAAALGGQEAGRDRNVEATDKGGAAEAAADDTIAGRVLWLENSVHEIEEWRNATLRAPRPAVWISVVSILVNVALVTWMVVDHWTRDTDPA